MATPHLINAFLSPRTLAIRRWLHEKRRQWKNGAHVITAYLSIRDPHSYLLLQVLIELKDRYDVEFDFRTVLNRQSEMFPAPSLWDRNAFKDALYLADLYELDFPKTMPIDCIQLENKLTAQLLHWELQPGYLENAIQLFEAYWNDDVPLLEKTLMDKSVVENVSCYSQHLAQNENLLKKNGHYLHGMAHYAGEWYWGLDRINYLERRLNDIGVCREVSEVKYDLQYVNFASEGPDGIPKSKLSDPLVIYWSIRSPYSYLGLVKARKLASLYGIPLVVKPVLPMVMRRMLVPKTKGMYIIQDTKREALQQGIPFGKIADPLGKGVERCYALYTYAESCGKGITYLETYARAVWSEGIRSDTDNGLKYIVEKSGLDWNEAKPRLKDQGWRTWAQKNLTELYGIGLWGVPSFAWRDTTAFGQDKLYLIEREIARL